MTAATSMIHSMPVIQLVAMAMPDATTGPQFFTVVFAVSRVFFLLTSASLRSCWLWASRRLVGARLGVITNVRDGADEVLDAQRVGVVIDDDSAGAELHLGAVHTGHAVEFCLDLVDAARARELIGAQDDVPQVCVGHCGSPSPSWMVCCTVRGSVQGACFPGCFLDVAVVYLIPLSCSVVL